MTKKLARKPSKPRRKRATALRKKQVSLAQDEAERQKIGKTLDIKAFMKMYKQNLATSMKYWQEKE
jgi:hypothetical protein